jgi:hypothetical protein
MFGVSGTTLLAGAVLGSAVIGAVGSNSAADTQAAAQQQASASQDARFAQIQKQSQPFMDAGYGATKSLTDLLGTTGTPGQNASGTNLQQGYLTSTFNPTQAELENYPGYKFALNQGQQAVRNAGTASSGALSSGTLKDIANYTTGAASQHYGDFFNQFQTQQSNIFNRLSAIAGLGQSSAAGVGNSGTQLGIGAAQALAGAGASQASGILGATSSLAGGANSLGSLAYLNQNSGGQYPGMTGNPVQGYTHTDPTTIGPPLPGP